MTAGGLPILEKAKTVIVQPLIWFFFGLALIFFLYGVYEMIAGGDNPEERQKGQQHVLWGVVGIAVMVSAAGILNLVCGTIGC